MTDFLQFILAMSGSIYLASAAFVRLGGMEGIRQKFSLHGFNFGETMRIIPEAGSILEANPFTEFLILILVVWWATYNVDGGGYLAQRLFAAKDERHSVFGYLWYSLAHICLRPWPWIIVGLCGMAMFGVVDDPETYYPLVMKTILPPGILGLVIASFFAAFMSTVDTQLSWGSSLLVNDFFRRFTWKGRTEREYLAVARISVVALAVLGAIASFAVDDISLAWKLIYSVTAGIGSVYMARWYWWRVNAWSEISAMVTALLCTFVFAVLSRNPHYSGRQFMEFPFSFAITVLITTPVWIAVTLITRPVRDEHLIRFYRRVRPGGPGWNAIKARMPGPLMAETGGRILINIVSGIVLINTALIGIGKLVLGEYISAFVLILVASTAGAVLIVSMRRMKV